MPSSNQYSDYFSHPAVQDKLVNLLFIYVKVNNTEYRQVSYFNTVSKLYSLYIK